MEYTATSIQTFRKQSPLWKRQFPTLRGLVLQQGTHLVHGRTSVELPHGVHSSKIIYGIRMTVEALKRIQLKVK